MPATARQKKAGPRANARELARGLQRELLRRVSITSHHLWPITSLVLYPQCAGPDASWQ